MRSSLLWFWQQSYGYRGRLVVCLLLGLLHIVLGLTFIYVSKGIVDIATGRLEGDMWQYVFVLAAMLLLRLGVFSLRYWLMGRVQQQFTNTLRSRFFQEVMYSPWRGREDKASGDVMSRLGEDLRVVVECVVSDLPSVVIAFFQLIAAAVFLFTMQPGLMLTLFFIMPGAILLSKLYYKVMRDLTHRVRKEEADIQSHLQESVLNRPLLLSLRCIPIMSDKLTQLHDQLYSTYTQRLKFSIKTHVFVQAGFSIGYYTAFVWGAHGIMTGAVTYGMMTAFLQLVGQVQSPILNLSSLFPAIVRATTAAERMREIIPAEANTSKPQAPQTTLPGSARVELAERPQDLTSALSLHHVTFRYPDGDRDILHDFSHTFQPGSSTAIIGHTGSGKSTLIRLLLGLLQPSEGSITIGDSPLPSINRIPLADDASAQTDAHPIAYVPQGNSLMRGTIRFNLQLGRPEATEDEMRDALTRACALFVYDLPLGLDSPCGEKGSGLSEGQAQRIAIARALLQPGHILILDEASSALDPTTERQILEDLQQQSLGKTLIWVTHHPVVKDYMDDVLVIE